MTRDEAAAALEALVEERGPDWVSHTWGIALDRLAGWLEGSEDLPDWMVVVMVAHLAGQGCGDVGCFEDRDHPPEVPEEVTETGWNAVPMPTVGRGEIRPTNMQESIADQIENCRTRPPWEDRIPAKSRGESLWDAYRQGSRYVYGKKIREMIDAAWKEAGEKCGVDALREYGWLPDIMPHDAWDIGCSWASIVDALAAVVRDAIEGDEA